MASKGDTRSFDYSSYPVPQVHGMAMAQAHVWRLAAPSRRGMWQVQVQRYWKVGISEF